MKKIIYLLLAMVSLTTVSCSDDEWGNDNSEMMNVFYFGFQDWGTFKNDLKYDAARGTTVDIPVQFWCSGTRSFDATVYYYVSTDLTEGTDFQIVDDNGSAINRNAQGAYEMVWDLRSTDTTNNHRVRNLHVKALNGNTGTITLQTFDPNAAEAISNTNTPNNINAQYEVHAFTQNYRVTVNVK